MLRSGPSSPLVSQSPSRASSPGIMTALMMSTSSLDSRGNREGEATTFFDDMVNSPRLPPSNIVELSPTTHLMDVYQRFFDGHPELLCPHGHSHHVTIGHDDTDSFEDQVLYSISDDELDMEMEMVLDSPPLLIRRARAMADQRQMVPRTIPLIADQQQPNETAIDTIHLMIHSPPSSNTASSGNAHHNMLGRQQQQQHSQHAQGGQGHSHSTNSNNTTNNTSSSTTSSSTNGNNTQGNDSHPNNNATNNHNRSDDSSSPPDQNQNQAPQRRKKASRAYVGTTLYLSLPS
ncbi:hypothetical protein BGZ82_003379 [Podila clonocystis]|nr:hypothetical protein BGZ82_003379 [Podila clonocystis]